MKKAKISNCYGYFDENTGEYVITRPDTPTPWMNYLGEGQLWWDHLKHCRWVLLRP